MPTPELQQLQAKPTPRMDYLRVPTRRRKINKEKKKPIKKTAQEKKRRTNRTPLRKQENKQKTHRESTENYTQEKHRAQKTEKTLPEQPKIIILHPEQTLCRREENTPDKNRTPTGKGRKKMITNMENPERL